MGFINISKVLWLISHILIAYFAREKYQYLIFITIACMWFLVATIIILKSYKKHPSKRHPYQSLIDTNIILGLLSLFMAFRALPSENHTTTNLNHELSKPTHSYQVLGQIDKIYRAHLEGGSYRIKILQMKSFYERAEVAPILNLPTIYVYMHTKNSQWVNQLYPGCNFQFLIFKKRAIRKVSEQTNFGAYLREQNILGTLYVKNNIKNLDCSKMTAYGKTLQWLQMQLEQANFSKTAQAITLGMLLGKSGFLSNQLKESGRELGVLHLFAASGLHLGIFYAMLFFPLALRFGKKHKLSLLSPLCLCFGYLWLLNFPLSLCRAFTFLCLYTLANLTHFRFSTASLIINSAVLLTLLFGAERMLSLGSLLSFGAVTAILLLYPIFDKIVSQFHWHNHKIIKFCCAQVAVSVAAHLGTTFTLLNSFHIYSFFSLIANVILVPLASLLLPALTVSLFWKLGFHFVSSIDNLTTTSLLANIANFPLTIAAYLTEGFVQLTISLQQWSLFRNFENQIQSIYALYALHILLLLALLYTRHLLQLPQKIKQSSRVQKTTKKLMPIIILLLIILIGPGGGFIFS